MDRLQDAASPQAIAQAARDSGAASVAFTYNDPVIFAEYAMDTADACHALGLKTVAVTAGYIRAEPRRAFFDKMDAANVDLKAFTDGFYRQQTILPWRRTGCATLKRGSRWTSYFFRWQRWSFPWPRQAPRRPRCISIRAAPR